MLRPGKDRRSHVDPNPNRQGLPLNAIPTIIVNESSSAAIRCHVPWRDALPVAAKAEPSSQSPRKSILWLLVLPTIAVLSWLLVIGQVAPRGIAGLSVREIAAVMAIIFFSGIMSGLSVFGFSAIGAVSLLFPPLVLQVPLFQALSTGNQFLSIGQLRDER